MIEGVLIKPLKIFSDDRGKVLHMLKSEDAFLGSFGEIYFSIINPGYVKAWKKHKLMTQHYAVPYGDIRLVIYYDRPKSSSLGAIQEIFLGLNNYCLVRIPPLVWYGFQSLNDQLALVANFTDIPHDPAEVINKDHSDKEIPFHWE